MAEEGAPVRTTATLRGVTVDFWHTLGYLRPQARLKLETARQTIWTEHLRASGLGDREAERWTRWIVRTDHRLEREGRAPSISGQARLLEGAAGVRVDRSALSEALDGALLGSPVRPLPGAVEALRGMRSRGLELALISNVVFESPRASVRVLERLGMARYLPVLAFSAEHPWSKPDPRIFRWALRELGVRPGEALHIGDLPLDVAGALDAGMDALRLTWEERARGVRKDLGPRDVRNWREAFRRVLARRSES